MEDRESFFTTQIFEFRVEGHQFFVHSGLISRFSSPLGRLISLNMKEKNQGFAILEDVTAPTFDRFLEWACKGCYVPPGPCEDKKQNRSPEKGDQEVAPEKAGIEEPPQLFSGSTDNKFYNRYGNCQARLSKQGNKVSITYKDGYIQGADRDWVGASTLRQVLKESIYSRKPVVRRGDNIAPPRKNLNAVEKYAGIFLCHAQLYVFADAQDIQPLKLLALNELRAVLAVFELYPERTGDIVELLRYGYANTASLSQGEEALRKLLSDYVEFQMDVLMKDERFKALMFEDGGDMLRDFLSSVSKRIEA